WHPCGSLCAHRSGRTLADEDEQYAPDHPLDVSEGRFERPRKEGSETATMSEPSSVLPDRAVSGVEGLAVRGVRVVLRRLATVVFPVVTYDSHSPDPCLVIRRVSILVGLRC